MALQLENPEQEVQRIVSFIQQTFAAQNIEHAVIAVSGGIDSALALSLLARSLPNNQIFPIFLPYKNQSMQDAKTICDWNNIPVTNLFEKNIGDSIDLIAQRSDVVVPLRLGNIMARVRMILTYDLAKEKHALVCGTENKSEKYLGYFTRFGDEASDIEPIQHLYKRQIRQLAKVIGLPQHIIEKQPTAGLWEGQSDEQELGFSYEDADKVLELLIDQNISENEIPSLLSEVSSQTIQKILQRVRSQRFKHEVPYRL